MICTSIVDRDASISKDTCSSASARKILLQQGTKKPKITDCEKIARTQSLISGLRFVDSNVLGSIIKRGWSDVSRLYVDVDVDVEVPLFLLLGGP